MTLWGVGSRNCSTHFINSQFIVHTYMHTPAAFIISNFIHFTITQSWPAAGGHRS